MSGSPPLRFLAIVLGGWAALRTALVAPLWSSPPAVAVAAPVRAQPLARARPEARPVGPERAVAEGGFAPVSAPERAERAEPPGPHLLAAQALPELPRATGLARAREAAPAPLPIPALPGALPGRPASASSRWSLSAWSFVRPGDAPGLAAGGLLGGSQAGARLGLRINRDSSRPLAFSVRLSAPLRRPSGAEAALGIDWRPARRLPVRFLAERRQALGKEGRSAFALTVHGGVGEAPLGPFRIDAYAQAGMVGARSRDPFADGSLRLSLPSGGRARIGAGAWAAAQPGLSRLDLGPQAALRLPVAGRSVTLAADWRFRIAGNAEPGSGPTLAVATDF